MPRFVKNCLTYFNIKFDSRPPLNAFKTARYSCDLQ